MEKKTYSIAIANIVTPNNRLPSLFSVFSWSFLSESFSQLDLFRKLVFHKKGIQCIQLEIDAFCSTFWLEHSMIHPGNYWTWNLKITQLKRNIIFHPPPFLGSGRSFSRVYIHDKITGILKNQSWGDHFQFWRWHFPNMHMCPDFGHVVIDSCTHYHIYTYMSTNIHSFTNVHV